MCAALKQALRNHYIEYEIDNASESEKRGVCGRHNGEAVGSITIQRTPLTYKGYKRRRDSIARLVL